MLLLLLLLLHRHHLAFLVSSRQHHLRLDRQRKAQRTLQSIWLVFGGDRRRRQRPLRHPASFTHIRKAAEKRGAAPRHEKKCEVALLPRVRDDGQHMVPHLKKVTLKKVKCSHLQRNLNTTVTCNMQGGKQHYAILFAIKIQRLTGCQFSSIEARGRSSGHVGRHKR